MTDSDLYDLARQRGFPEYRTDPGGLRINAGSGSWNKAISRFTATGADLDRQNAIAHLQALPRQFN